MNGGVGINYGNALLRNRRAAQPTPEGEPDVGNINVDALLGDSEDARQERAWTQSLRGIEAQQALNALQKVSMTINVYTLCKIAHSHPVDV
jgi:hypothetical protein